MERAVIDDERAARALDSLRFLRKETATRSTRKLVRGPVGARRRSPRSHDHASAGDRGLGPPWVIARCQGPALAARRAPSNPAISNAAIEALGRLGTASRDKVAPLADRFDEADKAHRLQLVRALAPHRRRGRPGTRSPDGARSPGLDRQVRDSLRMARPSHRPDFASALKVGSRAVLRISAGAFWPARRSQWGDAPLRPAPSAWGCSPWPCSSRPCSFLPCSEAPPLRRRGIRRRPMRRPACGASRRHCGRMRRSCGVKP